MELKTYAFNMQDGDKKRVGIAEISKTLDSDAREFQLQHPNFSYYETCKHLIKADPQKYAGLCK